jgi:hypothetical protein
VNDNVGYIPIVERPADYWHVQMIWGVVTEHGHC